MTRYQYDVYIAIKNYINKVGYGPTIRELCEMTGKSSPATIHSHLKSLKKKGYITYENGKSRTIRIIKEFERKYE